MLYKSSYLQLLNHQLLQASITDAINEVLTWPDGLNLDVRCLEDRV